MSRNALLQEAEYPEPPPAIRGSFLSLLTVLGPGAIVASVTVGTGETIFAPRVGALFGYAAFWVVLAAVLTKSLLVYSGARHLVLTGEHPAQAWMRLPGPRGWLTVVMTVVSLISFPLWIAAISDAVGSVCLWITGVGAGHPWGRPAWGTTVIVAAMTLTLVQTYQVLERVSLGFLILKMVFVLVAVAVVRPDWGAAVLGLMPQVPAYPAWATANHPEFRARAPLLELATLLGAVGGGVQDYLGYVSCMREKAWGLASRAMPALPVATTPEQLARARAWLRAPAFDILASFGSVFLITGLFMLLGAALLHPQQQVPTNADLYGQQAQFLGVVHPSLVAIYKAGIFFAMFGAVYGCFELYARSLYEPLRALWPDRAWSMGRVRAWNTFYCGILGLAILWTGFRTVTLANLASPLAGVLGCGLWCLAMVAVDARVLPAPLRMRPWLRVATVLSGLFMALVGGYTTFESWRRQ